MTRMTERLRCTLKAILQDHPPEVASSYAKGVSNLRDALWNEKSGVEYKGDPKEVSKLLSTITHDIERLQARIESLPELPQQLLRLLWENHQKLNYGDLEGALETLHKISKLRAADYWVPRKGLTRNYARDDLLCLAADFYSDQFGTAATAWIDEVTGKGSEFCEIANAILEDCGLPSISAKQLNRILGDEATRDRNSPRTYD